MKKSELKNIIRESIKELMNEQATSNARSHIIQTCAGGAGSTGLIRNLTVDGQVPVTGQYFNCADLGPAGSPLLINNSTNIAAGNFCLVGIERPEYLVGGQTDVTSLGSNGCPTNTGTSSCDNTMNGSCAQQWLPPSMNWNNMTNFACTGNNTYSGLISNRTAQVTKTLQAQPIGLPSGGVNTLLTGANSPFTSWSAISGWVNQTNQSAQSGGAGSISNPGQLKRRIAQLKWAECMNTECSC